ncbi:MAG: competence/damage-inducible protein A, partial [Deltaproteobacteria bacterium]|nr:competence/damage-inducible protein A [Deltaproteobacteria bacterium]
MKTAIGRGRASVLVIGDEILSGAVQDVNGAYFCRRLAELGLSVRRIEVVSDDIQEISDALRKCCTDSELVLTSGGLGPTSDDVTRDAVASFVGVPLILNHDSLQRMEDKYRERRIPLNKVSNRQVMFPESATVLLNRAGTAECFSVRSDSGALIASFPGIPRELQIVFEEILVPALEKDGIICPPLAAEHIKLFGLSESHIGDQIEKLGLQSSVRIGYRPMFPEILLKLTKPPECTGSLTLQNAVDRIVAAIGPEFVLCRSPLDSIADVLGELLIQTQRTVAFAESCTGGLASSLLSARPGASHYFCGAVVAYSNKVK